MTTFAALSPDVAAESAGAQPGEVRLLLHLLRQYFILGIKPEDGAALLRNVRQLPADLQMLWTEVLRAHLARTDLVGVTHSSVVRECRLPASQSREVLQVVEGTTSGVCSACGSTHSPWLHLDASAEVRAASRRQAMNVLARGMAREDVYAENFKSLAKVSGNCVVVDRYAGVRLRDRGDQAGLAWFGSKLIADGVQRIILVTGNRASAREISTAIGSLSSRLLRQRLRVAVALDSKFRDFGHDRFVTLQAGHSACTFSIGKGVEIFESPQMTQESSFAACDGAVVSRILADMRVTVAHHFV